MSKITSKELARLLQEAQAELEEAKAEVRRLQQIHLGTEATMIPLLEGLMTFGLEVYKGNGPRMTQFRVQMEGENLPIMNLWATVGEETPLTRISHLLALLNATSDERATTLLDDLAREQARRERAEEERDRAHADLEKLILVRAD